MVVFKDRTIHLCKHCGTVCTGVYCSQCKTAKGRKEMDTENKKINPNYVCKVCEKGWYSTFSQCHSDGLIK